jgi:hypothetical protein
MILIKIPIYINPLEDNSFLENTQDTPIDKCLTEDCYFAKMFTAIREETNIGSAKQKIISTRIYIDGDSFLSPLSIDIVASSFKELDTKYICLS